MTRTLVMLFVFTGLVLPGTGCVGDVAAGDGDADVDGDADTDSDTDSDSDSDADSDTGAGDFDAFVEGLAEIACAQLAACCSETAPDCRAAVEGSLHDYPGSLVTSGDVAYGPSCGSALLRLFADATCESLDGFLEVLAGGVPFGYEEFCPDGYIVGTVEAGGECSVTSGSSMQLFPLACRPGLCCYYDRRNPPTCTACTPVDAACGPEIPDCELTHWCDGGVCRPRLVEDAVCNPMEHSCDHGLACDDELSRCVIPQFCPN